MAINVPIISTFDSKGITKALRDFRKLETGSEKAAFTLRSVDKGFTTLSKSAAKFTAIGLGVAAVLSKPLLDAASNMQESMSKVQAVFGDAAGEVEAFANTSAKQLGISKRAALEAAGTYGNLFQAFGLTKDEAKDMSIRLVQLAADMASFNNVTVDDALIALRSGLSGETEPLKRFGVALNDQTLKLEALNLGLYSGKGNLTTYAKTQAAYALILKQTALQQGDVARTSDGVAFKMKSMGAQFEDVKAKLGQSLLPAFESIVSFVNEKALPTLDTFSNVLAEQGIGSAINYMAGSIFKGISSMGVFGKVILGVAGAFITLRAATIAYNGAQAVLRIATQLTTNELRLQALQANATKIAVAAATGVGAIIAVASTAYAIYAGRKAQAVQATNDFRAALKLEGSEQDNAIQKLYESDGNYRKHIDTLRVMGFTLDDVNEYLETGAGKISKLNFEFVKGTSVNDLMNMSMSDLRKGLGLASDTSDDMTRAVFNLTVMLNGHRKASLKSADAALATAQASGNAVKILVAQTDIILSRYSSLFGSAITEGWKRMRQTLLDTANGVSNLGDGLGGAGEGIDKAGKATDTAREKFQKYLKALRGYRDAKEDYEKAQKEVIKTQNDVTKATNAQTVAQAKFNQVVKGFGAGSLQAADAQKQLEQAQRDAERAGYDLEKSQFAVTDAERALEDARREGSAQEIREAEIALAEAKIAVKEAEIAQADATKAVDDAQKTLTETINGATESSQTYKDALKELEEANYDLQEAIDAANEALNRQRDAQENVNQSEREAVSEQKGLTPKQKKRAERRAQINVPKKKGAKGRAMGGSVYAGESYVIGERGRELFTPSANGVVTPNNKLGGDTYNIVVNSKIADETLPDLIVAELRKFNRRSGAIKIQVG